MGHLGIRTLGELSEMSYQDMLFWMTVYQNDPFGAWREDLRAAIIATGAVAPHTSTQVKYEDFMPKFGAPKQQSAEEITTMILNLKPHGRNG